MITTLSPAEVRAAADRLPRVPLAHLPTPLEELPRFSRAVGGGVRIFVKRDDCTGLLLGGNKARHNEFLLGDALAEGCDLLVWGGGTQSNNCRQTAAACARLGIECRLFLSRAHGGTEDQGNLLLDRLVGARVTFVDEPVGPALNALLEREAADLRRQGRNPYFWHPPTVVPLAEGRTIRVVSIVPQGRTGWGAQDAGGGSMTATSPLPRANTRPSEPAPTTR